MGLQNQLNDVSSGSIPLLLLYLLATSISTLRRFLLSFFHHDDGHDDPALSTIGSGLAGIVILTQQLDLNKALSYNYNKHNNYFGSKVEEEEEEEEEEGLDCVVCMDSISEGDQVRELPCRHVFHTECIHACLVQSKLDCPLCRFPLVSDSDPLHLSSRHLGGQLLSWFSSFW